MTIDYYYYKCDYKYYYTRQTEKKALESYFWKQSKALSTSNSMAFQNKVNISPVASSTKLSSSKPLFSTSKKQSNSP